MREGSLAFGIIKHIQGKFVSLGFLFFLLLTACSERQVEVSMLSRNFTADSEFKIINAENETDIVPDLEMNKVSLEVLCSKTIVEIGLKKKGASDWVNIREVHAEAELDCADKGTARFEIPLDDIAPYVSDPNATGDKRESFQIRYATKNKLGEIVYYERTLYALFRPGNVTLSVTPINAANASSNYTVSGTCSIKDGTIEISGPFLAWTNCRSDNTYSVSASLTSLTDGMLPVQVKLGSASSYTRTYGTANANILVDRTAPTLTIEAPVNGATFNMHTPFSEMVLSGSCSDPGQVVGILFGGMPVAALVCGSDSRYSGSLPAGSYTDGTVIISASHKDAAGNMVSVGGPAVTLDTTPSGTFDILGVTATGAASTLAGSVANSTTFRIHYQKASDAVKHIVTIRHSSGTLVCSLENTSAVAYVDVLSTSGCGVGHNGSYKLYVTAYDAAGNTRESNQNAAGKAFTVTLPAPTVASISTSTANGSYGIGTVIPIDIAFDQDVTVVGTPNLNLNFDSVQVSYSNKVNSKTLRFNYTVGANQNTSYLSYAGLQSLTLPAGATIKSTDHGVDANRDLSSASFATHEIRIDTTSPAVPTVSNYGVSMFYNRSPLFEATVPSTASASEPDGGNLILKATIYRSSDNHTMSPENTVPNATKYQIKNSGTLTAGTNYYLKVVVTDKAGNSSSATLNFQAFQCPTNFAYINNYSLVSYPFCMAMTEAKNGGGGIPAFGLTGVPWVNITYDQAAAACEALDTADDIYLLPGITEWNAVADLIARDPTNYQDGILQMGNHKSSSVAAIDTGDPYLPRDAGAFAQSRRFHYLPNNQRIWDFAGNALEFTYYDPSYSDWDYGGQTSNYVALLPANDLRTDYAPLSQNYLCATSTSSPYCGFGYIDISLPYRYLLRGGYYNSEAGSGVYSMTKFGNGTTQNAYIGFRCMHMNTTPEDLF